MLELWSLQAAKLGLEPQSSESVFRALSIGPKHLFSHGTNLLDWNLALSSVVLSSLIRTWIVVFVFLSVFEVFHNVQMYQN